MPTAAELFAAHAACERFLSGHGRPSPRELLARLADEARPEERTDVYGEGALMADFEAELAKLLGKPAAVFLPSGTMAQQIAARLWADRRRVRTVAWHPTCHLEIHEQKGYQAVHGLRARLVGDPRAPITRADLDAVREPIAMLLIELPQREIGGLLPSWEGLGEQIAWARERGAAAHLDGARLWECGPYYGRPYAEIAELFDSVYVSFYKGLGGIAGAALAGDADFIAEARVWQRRHGGNLVAMWPLVLAARWGLRHRLPRMAAYRDRAVAIARRLAALDGVTVHPALPPTNMTHVYLRGDADAILARALAIAERERTALFLALRRCDLPGWQKVELTIGDGAERFTDDEVAGLFARLVG